jgi:hypothetical protein
MLVYMDVSFKRPFLSRGHSDVSDGMGMACHDQGSS